MKRSLIAAALAVGIAGTGSAAAVTMGDQYVLRAYTGQALGLALTKELDVHTLGIAQNRSSICATLGGAIAGEAVAHNRDNNVLSSAALADASEAAEAVQSLLDKEAIVLAFGGEIAPEDNQAMVSATLKALADADYEGRIVLHVAVWAPKMLEKAAAEHAEVAEYLAGKDNLNALTIDAAQQKALLHEIALEDGKQTSRGVIHEMEMNDSWTDLFKASVAG
ncbi:hypothetical protein [Guyparkeria sp.]|uniref:hypothetical protein n=1 Tax=Guyparkeria sp. TaxID=2035736 RepID=UPI003567D8FC